MKTKCLIPMNPIPKSYEGNLNMGMTDALSENVRVSFAKPNPNGGVLNITALTAGDGTLVLTIQQPGNAFFSQRYGGYIVTAVKDPSQVPISFIDPDDSSEKEGLLLPFSEAECPLPVYTDLSLTKKTDGCSC